MLSFVKTLDAGIDKEIFCDIDDEMMNKLFNDGECGFRKKFSNKLAFWKSGNPIETDISTLSMSSNHVHIQPEISQTMSTDSSEIVLFTESTKLFKFVRSSFRVY